MPFVLGSEGTFTWLSLLPWLQGERSDLLAFAHSMLAVLVCLVFAWMARVSILRAGKRGRDGLVPESRLDARNVFELYAEAILNLCRGVLGKDAETFFPLIAGVFLYIFASNMLGVLPGFLPPTDQLNTDIPMALTVFVVYNAVGLARQGPLGYLKHFMGPVLWLAPLMAMVEVISHLSRPLSLSVRLYGNIMGDHQVLQIFMDTLPDQLSPVLGFGIPVLFLGLGVFVSFIQALVFSLLSVSYIGLAAAHNH